MFLVVSMITIPFDAYAATVTGPKKVYLDYGSQAGTNWIKGTGTGSGVEMAFFDSLGRYLGQTTQNIPVDRQYVLPSGNNVQYVSLNLPNSSVTLSEFCIGFGSANRCSSNFLSTPPIQLQEPHKNLPASPSNLQMVEGNKEVTLTWLANVETDLASYKVYRDGALIATLGKTVVTYKATGLTNLRSYEFGVTAVDIFGNESPKSLVTAVPYDPNQPPNKPTGLVGTAGDKQVTLNWDANSDAINGYNVYKDGLKLNQSLITQTSYVVTGLSNAVEYRFSISAVKVLESQRTSEIVLKPLSANPPNSPEGLTGIVDGLNVDLTWTPNAIDDEVIGYNIYKDGVKQNTTPIGATGFRISNLLREKAYSFQVSAVNTSGLESAKSPSVNCVITSVMDFSLIANKDSIIVQVAGGKPPYTVEWNGGKQTFSGTDYTINDLTPMTDYGVRITDSEGQTVARSINTGRFKGFNPPVLPTVGGVFQGLIDNFGLAGAIGVLIVSAGVALGAMIILGIWGWRRARHWLSAAK